MLSISLENIYKNKLFIDFINNKLDIKPPSEKDLEIFREKAKEIFSYSYNYQNLNEVLLKQNEEFLRDKPFGNNIISILKKKNYLCVVSGQQPGLLGGPLYTLFKILTIIKLSKWIQNHINTPCLPIFWVVSEDDDIKEITDITLISQNWNLFKLAEDYYNTKIRQIISSLSCSSDPIANIINKAKSLLLQTIYTNDIIQLISDSYKFNFTIPKAFIKFMHILLKDYPILFLDPSEDNFKRNASPILFKLTNDYKNISELISKHTDIIKNNGYIPQIKLNKNQLPFFFIENNKRLPLILEDKVYLKGTHKIFPLKDFLKLIVDNPLKFTPNVISRPLIQDYLIPNIAYVAGPAEISYLYQIYPLYKYLNIPSPLLIPRHSATLLFHKAAKIIQKNKIPLPEFICNKNYTPIPPNSEEISSLFNSFKENLSSSLRNLSNDLKSKNIHIPEKEEETKDRIINCINKFEKLCLLRLLEKNKNFQEHLKILTNLIKPFNHLQERELSLINLLILEGTTSINTIYEKIELFEFKHNIYESS